MLPTRDMYSVTHHKSRIVHIKVDLLDYKLSIIESIIGRVIDGTLSSDANSDIRRTCTINMIVDNTNEQALSTIYWMDKYMHIYIGLEDIVNNNIIWFNKGIYMFNQPEITVNTEGTQMSFSGVDLMGRLTEERGGVLGDGETQFEIGQPIRDIIIELIKLRGFESYVIEIPPDDVLQENLSYEPSQTIYDILCDFRNTYYPNYQTYFDEDGVFRFYKIPTGESDAVVADQNTFDLLCMSYSDSVNLDEVRNSIEIYGKTHEPQYYGVVDDIVDDTYNITCAELEGIDDYTNIMIDIEISEVVNNPKLNINNTGALPVVNSSGEPYSTSEIGLFVFLGRENSFFLVGNLQSYAKVQDENPESPFYINSTIGELKLVLSGEDYDLINTDELALERAKYELYSRCRLNDTISILTVPILYLDVYDLIEFKTYDGKTHKYMIQNINTPLNGSGQTLTVSRFYPEYTII